MTKIHSEIISRFPDQFEYIRFNEGKEIEKFKVKKGDKLYDNLLFWLSQKNDKWKRSYDTFAYKNLFYAKKININVIDGAVVINFNIKNTDWIQVIREIEKGDNFIPNECK